MLVPARKAARMAAHADPQGRKAKQKMPVSRRVSATNLPSLAVGGTVAFLLVFLSILALPAGAGADEKFRIDFDDNEIAIGPIRDIPIQQITRAAAIEGSVDSRGRVTIPKGMFTLPVLGVDEPIRVRAFMGIDDEATGTWDPGTGKLEIQAKAGIWLAVNVGATIRTLQAAGVDLNLGPAALLLNGFGDLTCGFSPMDLTFTTETTSLGTGKRFTKGLNGPGALTAGWSQLGPFAGRAASSGLNFDEIACQLLRTALPGIISSSLQGILPAGVDLGGLDIAGLLRNLDDVNLGPSSITISRAADQSKPAGLRMSTLRKAVRLRAGKRVRIPMRVSNPGDVPASRVKICPRLPKKSRTTGRCVSVGTIGPGKSLKRNLVLKARRNPNARSGKKRQRRGARVRSVQLRIVATGSGLPTQTSGIVIRVVG